jgi:hypothetical protein
MSKEIKIESVEENTIRKSRRVNLGIIVELPILGGLCLGIADGLIRKDGVQVVVLSTAAGVVATDIVRRILN